MMVAAARICVPRTYIYVKADIRCAPNFVVIERRPLSIFLSASYLPFGSYCK